MTFSREKRLSSKNYLAYSIECKFNDEIMAFQMQYFVYEGIEKCCYSSSMKSVNEKI